MPTRQWASAGYSLAPSQNDTVARTIEPAGDAFSALWQSSVTFDASGPALRAVWYAYQLLMLGYRLGIYSVPFSALPLSWGAVDI